VLNDELFSVIFTKLIMRITFIEEDSFKHLHEEAIKISPDLNDAVYFSLSLYKGIPLWSNDKKLKEQNHVKVYATHELKELLDKNNFKK